MESDDDDLEDELLKLAGHDASSRAGTSVSGRTRPKRSAVSEVAMVSEEEEGGDQDQRGADDDDDIDVDDDEDDDFGARGGGEGDKKEEEEDDDDDDDDELEELEEEEDDDDDKDEGQTQAQAEAGKPGRKRKLSQSASKHDPVPLKKRTIEKDVDEEQDEEDDEDEEEEGAVYENGAEADDDDADADADADDEEPPFGEDLYIDEEDRQELEKKPELEREMILTERAERRQTWLDSKRLREEARNRKAREAAAVAAVKPAAGTGKKRTRRKVTKGSSISEDAPVPMSDDKKKKAEALKRLSERKKKQDVQRAGRQKRRGGFDQDYEGEFDDDYEETQEQVELEDEEEEGEFEDPDGPVEEEARYEDVLSVCLSRYRLEKWHLEPYFEQVVPGCFIRVPMADDGEERLYKVFQIESVIEDLDKPFYKFGGRNNSAYKTNKFICISRGSSTWNLGMNEVSSDKKFTREEFESYVRALKTKKCALPTLKEINQVRKNLLIPETFSYKAEDVKKLVEKKKEASSMQFSLTREKQHLIIKIKAIEDNMDMLSSQENLGINQSETLKELEKLKSRLEALEEKISLKQEYETAADEQRKIWTKINRRNREITRQQDEEKYLQRKKEEAEGKGADSEMDPFARRHTRSQNYWNVNRTKERQDAELAQKMEEEKRQKKAEEEMKKREAESKITPLGNVLDSLASVHAKVEESAAEDESIGLPDFHKQLQSLHNFELEIPALDKAYDDKDLVQRRLQRQSLSFHGYVPPRSEPVPHENKCLTLEEYEKMVDIKA